MVLVVLSTMMAGLIYVYVPETKGRSLEDMAVFFATITGDRSVLDHMENATNNSENGSTAKFQSRTSVSLVGEPPVTIEMRTLV